MPQAKSLHDDESYERMMSEIRTQTIRKARKHALNAGRQRLAHLPAGSPSGTRSA